MKREGEPCSKGKGEEGVGRGERLDGGRKVGEGGVEKWSGVVELVSGEPC